jgi:hypothetical protein
MADYSGYIPRQQQQDPNMAAWAQISGNIANIFGLDPAKAAEARRGLQQEDYNELRNQAQIRQQLANKRMGELFKRINPMTGEFDNPSDYQEYASLTAEMGSNPNTRLGTGFGANELKIRLDAEERKNAEADRRAGVKRDADTKEAAAKQAAEDARKIASEFDQRAKWGGRTIRFVPPQAYDNFSRAFDATGPRNLSERFQPTPETASLPENQRIYQVTPVFTEWMNNNNLGTATVSDADVRYGSSEFQSGKAELLNAVAMKFGISQQDIPKYPGLVDLVERIYAGHMNAQISDPENTPIPAVSTQGQIDKIIKKAQADPSTAPEYILIRVPKVDPQTGDVTFSYMRKKMSAILKMSPDNPNHPINILQGAR